MAEDSTPVSRASLDASLNELDGFIEQQQNALKQLTVQYEDLEDKVELVDCFYTQLDGNQEENRHNLEKLEKRVTKLEGHQQVFAMYQSQPPDEEGWDEMTAAMKAAEEHEARKKLTVNGLTADEWQDLLRLK